MPYRLTQQDESVEAGVRRIAREQIDKAIVAIDDGGLTVPQKVHDIRKRCKKLRGLVRLVRPCFKKYKEENAAFRDMAGMIAELRDAKVLTDSYDRVADAFDDQIERRETGRIRRRLTMDRRHLREEAHIAMLLNECRTRLQEAATRVDGWRLKKEGWKAVSGGLLKTYKRARKAQEKTLNGGDAAAHHEWRKRVKYHWHHCRLLQSLWKGPMKARAREAHRLSDLLGDHHDLAVFRATLATQAADASDGGVTQKLLIDLSERQAKTLSKQAGRNGARLLVDKPDVLETLWHIWWKAHARETKATAKAKG